MEQRALGDRCVSALGMGGAQWSLSASADDQQSEALLLLALRNGVTYIDTATAYTTAEAASHNEKLIARVLSRNDFDVVVGTKAGHFRDGSSWFIDGRPESIRAHCEASLTALGVGELDLLYLHKPDPLVPFEDSVGELENLRREGKTVRTGISNVSRAQFEIATTITPLSAIQNPFSPFNRQGVDLMRACERVNVAYFAYSPLGGEGRPSSLESVLPETNRVALKKHVSLQSVILSWELALSPVVIPIIGASRKETLLDALTASPELLDEELRRALEADLEMAE